MYYLQASNPGNFDNDCDYAWLKGTNPEIVYHHVSLPYSLVHMQATPTFQIIGVKSSYV